MNQRRNSEDTITTMFLDILTPMHSKWEIDEQTPRPFVENDRKPDAIVRTTERYPLAVEVKPDVYAGVSLLRRMLCREPSIHGGKRL